MFAAAGRTDAKYVINIREVYTKELE